MKGRRMDVRRVEIVRIWIGMWRTSSGCVKDAFSEERSGTLI